MTGTQIIGPQHAASSVVSLRSDETDHCRELARRMGSNRQLVGALHGACAHPAGVGQVRCSTDRTRQTQIPERAVQARFTGWQGNTAERLNIAGYYRVGAFVSRVQRPEQRRRFVHPNNSPRKSNSAVAAVSFRTITHAPVTCGLSTMSTVTLAHHQVREPRRPAVYRACDGYHQSAPTNGSTHLRLFAVHDSSSLCGCMQALMQMLHTLLHASRCCPR